MRRTFKIRRLKKPEPKRGSKKLTERQKKASEYQSITRPNNRPEIEGEKLCRK